MDVCTNCCCVPIFEVCCLYASQTLPVNLSLTALLHHSTVLFPLSAQKRIPKGYVVCPSDKRFLLLFTFLKKNRKKKIMVRRKRVRAHLRSGCPPLTLGDGNTLGERCVVA